MNLTDLFDATAPSVVAFVSTVRFAPVGQRPIFPHIFGTGFFVSEDGIAATNRHVVQVFDRLPKHPKTGVPLGAAILFLPGTHQRSWQMLRLDLDSIHVKRVLPDGVVRRGYFGARLPTILRRQAILF